jgi:hypothetical protein
MYENIFSQCSRLTKTFPEVEKENLGEFIREKFITCDKFIEKELHDYNFDEKENFEEEYNDLFDEVRNLCSREFFTYFVFATPFCLCGISGCKISVPNKKFIQIQIDMIKSFNHACFEKLVKSEGRLSKKYKKLDKYKYILINKFIENEICDCNRKNCSYWKLK